MLWKIYQKLKIKSHKNPKYRKRHYPMTQAKCNAKTPLSLYLGNSPQCAHAASAGVEEEASDSAYLEPAWSRVCLFGRYLMGSRGLYLVSLE